MPTSIWILINASSHRREEDNVGGFHQQLTQYIWIISILMVLKYDIEFGSMALHDTQKVNTAGGFCVTRLVNSTEILWLVQ